MPGRRFIPRTERFHDSGGRACSNFERTRYTRITTHRFGNALCFYISGAGGGGGDTVNCRRNGRAYLAVHSRALMRRRPFRPARRLVGWECRRRTNGLWPPTPKPGRRDSGGSTPTPPAAAVTERNSRRASAHHFISTKEKWSTERFRNETRYILASRTRSGVLIGVGNPFLLPLPKIFRKT